MAYELSSFLLAHDFLIKPPYTCKPNTPMAEVYKMMKKFNVDYTPVIDEDSKFYGIIEHRAVQKLFTKRIYELKQKELSMES